MSSQSGRMTYQLNRSLMSNVAHFVLLDELRRHPYQMIRVWLESKMKKEHKKKWKWHRAFIGSWPSAMTHSAILLSIILLTMLICYSERLLWNLDYVKESPAASIPPPGPRGPNIIRHIYLRPNDAEIVDCCKLTVCVWSCYFQWPRRMPQDDDLNYGLMSSHLSLSLYDHLCYPQ